MNAIAQPIEIQQPNQQGHPTLAEICETQAFRELYEAMRKWDSSGRPHKR